MFTPNQIRERVHVQPFTPFRVVTSSGESYEVHHPELIMVGHREVTIGSPSSHSPAIYDRMNRVALMHVTALEDLPRPAPPTSNGQQ